MRLTRSLVIAGSAIAHNDATIRCTCSFGVAQRDQVVLSLDALLVAADAALYQAKAAGCDTRGALLRQIGDIGKSTKIPIALRPS